MLVSLSNKSENQNLLIESAASFYSFKKGISNQKNPSSLMGSIALIRQTLLDAEWHNNQKTSQLCIKQLMTKKIYQNLFQLMTF